MNALLVFFFVLAFGNAIAAGKEPTPSLAKGLLSTIIDAITGSVKASPHIVGGKEAESHSHPHQVALFTVLEGGEQSFCGGSLITPLWVLTAAHCMEKVNEVHAILGAHTFETFEPDRQVIPVEKILKHRDWDNYIYVNDIALLKLRTKAKLDKKVQTIRLPSLASRNKSLHGITVVMTGWGKFSEKNETYSPVLRSAESTVITNEYCNLKYDGRILSTMVCADGSTLKGVCNGDSGGPLVTTETDGQKTLIGVTSFGAKLGCEGGYPTVFTRVDQFLGWIANTIRIRLRE